MASIVKIVDEQKVKFEELTQKANGKFWKKGEPKDQLELSRMYAEGRGVERDMKKAVEWLLKVAKRGDDDYRAAGEAGLDLD